MLQERLIPQQIFLPILLAVKLPLLNPFPQAAMMYEMPAVQPPQKGLLLIRANNALQLLDLDIQLLAFYDIPSSVLAEVAGQSAGQEVVQSPRCFQFSADEAELAVQLFLALAVLALAPLLLPAELADETVTHVAAELEAKFAEGHVLTVHALVYRLIGLYFLELASIAVIIILLAYFLIDHLLLMLDLLLPDLLDDLWWFLIPAERTLDDAIVVHLVLGPLREALQVEGVHADSGAGGDCIAFYDLHVADSAEIVVVVLVLVLLNDHILAGEADLDVFQEIGDLVVVDAAVGDDVPEFFIGVGGPEEERVVGGEVEDLEERMEGVHAVLRGGIAGAFELVADGDLEFYSFGVFENKTSTPRYAHQVELLELGDEGLGLAALELLLLLGLRLRHTIQYYQPRQRRAGLLQSSQRLSQGWIYLQGY